MAARCALDVGAKMLIGQKITIVGAGIGGLAAAIALAQHGASVRVVEQADAISEVGAGLQISPNGLAVLRGLGIDLGAGGRSGAVRLIDGLNGRDVLYLDLLRHALDQEFQLWHRADLIAALAARADEVGVKVETARPVLAARQSNGGITLEFADGTAEEAALVIGADGLHSKLRGLLNQGQAAPFFTGHVAWRALVSGAGLAHPAQAQVHMGPKRHVVTYPLRDGALINIVGVVEASSWAEEGWHHAGDPADMQREFAGFAPGLRGLLARVETVNRWGLFRHPVAAKWHLAGAAALLGDAAHPTLPFMAQGANMALEDAWVLAECLAQGDPEEGLAAYQIARRSRCARIVEAANRNASAYHLSGPARGPALAAMRLGGQVAPKIPLKKFDWIYRYDVTA